MVAIIQSILSIVVVGERWTAECAFSAPGIPKGEAATKEEEEEERHSKKDRRK